MGTRAMQKSLLAVHHGLLGDLPLLLVSKAYLTLCPPATLVVKIKGSLADAEVNVGCTVCMAAWCVPLKGMI